MTPSATPFSVTTSGVPPPSATLVDELVELGRRLVALVDDEPPYRLGRALADRAAVDVDTADARLRAEGDERGARELALAEAEALLGEDHDRAPLRRLVGQAGELGRIGELALGDARQRQELRRLAVAERDRARLVEQQGGAVAGGLDGTPGPREHVVLHEAVHAGDADRGEQGADGRRDQAHEQGREHDHVLPGARVDGERLQGDHGDEKDDRQAGEQDVERDLVGGLLPRRPLDERDHAVEEARAGFLRDAHDDLVGEHARAAGDRGAVTARLADHRRRLAGDRRLVHAGDALDHLAVGGDQLAGRDHDHVAERQPARRHLLEAAVLAAPVGDRLGAGAAQRLGLGLAPALGHRLREVREQDGEPEPGGDRPREDRRLEDRERRHEHAGHLDHEHDRVAGHAARVELEHGVPRRPAHQPAVEHRGGLAAHSASCSTIGPSASTGK